MIPTFVQTSLYSAVLALFSSGASGAFLDANDWANVCFQDAAGTTPVTAMEQPIGLIRDKSGRGNDAKQTVSANRPVISARYNEMVRTENLSVSPWSGSNAAGSVAAVALPPNVSAAGLVTATAGAGYHYLSQISSTSSAAGASVTQYYWLKKGTTRWGWIGDGGDAVWHGATIDFDGSAITEQTNGTATIVSTSGTWLLVKFVYTRTNAGANRALVAPSVTATTGGTAPNYTAAGTETVYATGIDSRPSDQATGLIPTYQRVNTATDYDWSPAFPPMIKGNGSNQYLTGNLDLSSTNKVTVWAGVRKFVDVTTSVLVELSANSSAGNNGSFGLLLNASGNSDIFNSSGTSRDYALIGLPSAPHTNTFVGKGNISAPSVFISANNGAYTNTSTGSQGTGNYGSYPYYLLSRAGSSLFSSGGFNTIIVLGAAATDAQISTTEAYCNQKLRAY